MPTLPSVQMYHFRRMPWPLWSVRQLRWRRIWCVDIPRTILSSDSQYLQEGRINKLGITALAISSNTLKAAEKEGRNLWLAAEKDATVLLVTPEMLTSKGFEHLIQKKQFEERTFALIIDEVHLMNSWGVGFRPPFLEVGNMRARLPSRTVLLALTATMRSGQPIESVCGLLGLRQGRFHLIRRSNARHDVQILFRTMRSGFGSATTAFPDLDWVLHEKGKTLIFARSIHLGFRVALYLWYKDLSIDVEERQR